MDEPLLRMVDAVSFAVSDLDAGLDFYVGRLGHELAWRDDELGQAGLRCPDTDTEIVLSTTMGAERTGSCGRRTRLPPRSWMLVAV